MDKKSSNFNFNKNVFIFLGILLVLLFASIALLCTVLIDYVGGDRNVISIFPGDVYDKNGYRLDYVDAMEHPAISIFDEGVEWADKTEIDLFKNTYTNASGEVTVESADGDKVIAPGTSNSYEFTLKNTGNISLYYRMTLEGIFTLADVDLPFEVRISTGNEWVVGNENKWIPAKRLQYIRVNKDLERGKAITFKLEWQWPYELGDDENYKNTLRDLNDTILGDKAVQEDLEFTLNINTLTTISSGAKPVDPNGNKLFDEILVRQEVLYIGIPLILIGLCVPLLIILFFFRGTVGVDGVISGCTGTVVVGRRKVSIATDGRFSLGKLPLGRQKLAIQNAEGVVISSGDWYLKREKGVEGMTFKDKGAKLYIMIGPKVQAIELYLNENGGKLEIDQNRSRAVDGETN